jgi:L,D-transpeptidase catalytic domain
LTAIARGRFGEPTLPAGKICTARIEYSGCATPRPLDFLRELRIKTLRKFMERSFLRLLSGVLSVGLVLLVTGCTEDPRFSADTQYIGGVYGGAPPAGLRDTVSYWDGDQASGSPSIKISLGEQRAYFYKSGVLVGVSQLSTGREGTNTPTGSFKIIQKDKDHASNLFGDYVDSAGNVVVANIDVKKDPKPPGTHFRGTPMPYFMRIVSGTGLHAGFLPGYPASHGCIRMPEFMAENFFRSVSVGTPVTITH